MNKFEFSSTARHWDAYKCFHVNNGPFVEFETGELILRDFPNPNQRREYDKYGIRLVSTTDARWCPQLYLDKACTEEVKSAWVTQGRRQIIAVDHEQRVAVKVNERWGVKTEALQYLGKHLRSAAAVWTGPNRLPIPLAKITVSKPDSTVRKELASKLDEVRTAVTAAARIKSLSPVWGDDKLTAKAEWADMSVEDIYANVCANDYTMRCVATNGFAYPRAETQHDFLYIK